MNKLSDFNRYLGLLLGLLLLLAVFPVWSQSIDANEKAEPVKAFIRAQLLPEAGVRGQKRVLQINIYTRYWFKRVPKMPPLNIVDAVVIQPKGFGVNFTEPHHGVNYNVQTQEYQLFPQRQGVFVIPALLVNFAVQRELGPEEVSLETEPLYMVAKPLAPEQARVLVAKNLTLQQRYAPMQNQSSERNSEQPTVTVLLGQLFDRQIELRAESSLAMLINPFAEGSLVRDERGVAYTAIDGGRRYREVLSVKDDNNRGQTTASRKERWRYVFDRSGEFFIPAVSVNWFDTDSQSWQQASLPQLRVSVVASDGATQWWLGWGFALLSLIAVAYYVRTHLCRLAGRLLDASRTHLNSSEWYCWRRLNRACKQHRSDQILLTFYAWRQCYTVVLAERDDAAALDLGLASGLGQEWSVLFSRQVQPNWLQLLQELKQYRHSLKRHLKNNQKSDSRLCLPDIFKP